jgi:hypothetical protein
MFVVSVVCCQVEVSATSWSPVQRSPTDCGASLCVIYKPRQWGGPGPLGVFSQKKICYNCRKSKDDFSVVQHVASSLHRICIGWNTKKKGNWTKEISKLHLRSISQARQYTCGAIFWRVRVTTVPWKC